MAQQPARPGFDMSKLSTASKIFLGAGILYFIDLFLPWRRQCVSVPGFSACASQNGLAQGVGIINMLLVLAILVMEGLTLANVQVNMGTPQTRNKAEAGLAGGLLVFTILKLLVGLSHIFIFSFIGLILAAGIGYAGWMRWQEAQMGSAPPSGPPAGGFSA